MIFTSALLVILATFLVGYPVQRLWFDRCLPTGLAFPMTLTIGTLIIANIQFLTFLTDEPAWLINGLLYVVVLVVLVVFMRHRKVSWGPLPWPLLAIAVTFVLYGVALLIAEPSYDTGFNSDWAFYYPNVPHYLHHGLSLITPGYLRTEYLFKRTPLMILYGAWFHSFLGPSYAWFQIVTSVQNAIVLLVVLGLGGQFCGKRAGWLAMLILPIQPFITRLTFLPMPKMMAAAYLLLALALYLRWRDHEPDASDAGRRLLIAFAIASCAALMAHPSMLFYLIWIAADQLRLACLRRGRRDFWLVSAVAIAVLVLPWFLWSMSQLGFRQALTPSATISSNAPHPHYLVSRLVMIGTTLGVPSPVYVTWRAIGPDFSANHGFIPWGHAILRVYWDTFAGGLTLSGCLGLIAALIVRRRTERLSAHARATALFCLLGATLCLLMHIVPEDKGLAATLMTPLFLVVYLWACSRWAALPGWALGVLVAGIGIEFVGTRWLVYQLTHDIPDRFFEYVYDVANRALGLGMPMAVMLIVVTLVAYYAALWHLWRQRDAAPVTPTDLSGPGSDSPSEPAPAGMTSPPR